MRCFILLTLLILATLAISATAGKVTINGACVDCNKPGETGTRKSTSTGRPTTAKPKAKGRTATSSAEDDDLSMGDWTLSQDAKGGQHIAANKRHKRQYGGRQVIFTDDTSGFSNGGRVTTLDSRGYPGTLVRNNDCVGCNIRG